MAARPIFSISTDQPQPAAVRFLRVENAEPTLLGEPSPEDFGHHRRFRHPLTHKDKDSEAFAFEELSGAAALLSGAPVTAAVEAHHVAEMRPQSLGPGSVRRLAPFGRVRNFGRRKMVERHITLGGAGAAVAVSARGAGHRTEAGRCSLLYHSFHRRCPACDECIAPARPPSCLIYLDDKHPR